MRYETKALPKKRGPKVDLVAREKELKASLKLERGDYRLISYGRHVSTFKHCCGNVFDMGNRSLLNGSGKCTCQHKKIALHSKKSLQEWHDQHKTNYTVVKYVESNKLATLKCQKCKHNFEIRKFYTRRCPNCYPNLFSAQAWDPELYAAWIKVRQPGFIQLDTYVDSKTKIRFKHRECSAVFETTTPTIARPNFRCPHCSPKLGSAYRSIIRGTRKVKLRGKETVALDWILANTSIKLSDVEFDSEGTVPKITYCPKRGHSQTYKPDMFVRCRNLVIEVKDLNTLGFCKQFFYRTGKQLWDTNCSKARACIEQGFKFKMIVLDRNNKRIKLPENWYEVSHTEAVKWAKARGVI